MVEGVEEDVAYGVELFGGSLTQLDEVVDIDIGVGDWLL